MSKMSLEHYEEIMSQICDILENGDIVEDFINEPNRATTLGIIHTIVRRELKSIKMQREVISLLRMRSREKREEE